MTETETHVEDARVPDPVVDRAHWVVIAEGDPGLRIGKNVRRNELNGKRSVNASVKDCLLSKKIF